jgi:SAM-dependent methyltransferase
MTESLLDFYRRHRISPVRQEIGDLAAHFGRREALYRHLGILPRLVRGATVLEVGPGSGFNSLYTASLGPSRYVLLEPNPRGVADIRALFGRHPALAARVDIVPAPVEEYERSEPFDFVFCEGVLGLAGLSDPTELLRIVADRTAPEGVLVITCIDAISDFSEVLRRFTAQRLIDPAAPLDRQLEILLPVFAPHLSTLDGMTRRHDDWIVDNLLNPASIGSLLSIPDAIAALDRAFDVYGASPRFLTDWRWYKSIAGVSDRCNQLAADAYWASVHNLLDYRCVWKSRDATDNRRLYDRCADIRSAIHDYERTRDPQLTAHVLHGLEALAASVRTFSVMTADAMTEAIALLAPPSPDAGAIARSRAFAAWFGRGQQYLSFTRRAQ